MIFYRNSDVLNELRSGDDLVKHSFGFVSDPVKNWPIWRHRCIISRPLDRGLSGKHLDPLDFAVGRQLY